MVTPRIKGKICRKPLNVPVGIGNTHQLELSQKRRLDLNIPDNRISLNNKMRYKKEIFIPILQSDSIAQIQPGLPTVPLYSPL